MPKSLSLIIMFVCNLIYLYPFVCMCVCVCVCVSYIAAAPSTWASRLAGKSQVSSQSGSQNRPLNSTVRILL